MNNNQHYTIYGPAGLTIDVCGTAEKALSKASQPALHNQHSKDTACREDTRTRRAVRVLVRDGLHSGGEG